MATRADPLALAAQARQIYLEVLIQGLPQVVQALLNGAKALAAQTSEPSVSLKRRDLALDLPKSAERFHSKLLSALQSAKGSLQPLGAGPSSAPKSFGGASSSTDFSLVDDDTIEREILGSRMALALMDAANWQFADLRSRLAILESKEELDTHDLLRPHVISKYAVDAWLSCGLDMSRWRTAQSVIHTEFAHLVDHAYHETNRWLLNQGVRTEIDLRPLIRRSASSTSAGPLTSNHGSLAGTGSASRSSSSASQEEKSAHGPHDLSTSPSTQHPAGVHEETRLMTRAGDFHRATGSDHAEAVLGRLNRLIAKQVPEFGQAMASASASSSLSSQQQQQRAQTPARSAGSPQLKAAIAEAQNSLQKRLGATSTTQRAAMEAAGAPQQILKDLQHRKQALKEVATTPVERATIEIVALMFQAILTEERIPATVRVWFARLQMPVLRVAVTEPDFFATTDHPARKLIDRMGACVMGFQSNSRAVGNILEREIRRVVQVVEAYPDTGRRVFQTVLTEFEKFLEHYFKNENEATRQGVSLAQQVEQRETLAVQYTIELRKMLENVPVQDGLRDFLFKTWADVLATCAIKHGGTSMQTKVMTKAAADLIWSASAKVSREERAEVIRRLPPLLKTLREGMGEAGVGKDQQDIKIQALNDTLAAAFTAKTEVIPRERMQELTERLETLEEVLQSDVVIDDSIVLDLSGYEAAGLEVVADGGSMPTPAMLDWAKGLQVGSWFMLDYRSRNEGVQLAWQGMHKHLSLFVTSEGRGILFQHQRLAAFLQAGLLVPAQEESLTVRATRDAMRKLDADPERLLH